MGFAPDKSLLGFSTCSSLLKGSGGAGPSSITVSLVWGVDITLSSIPRASPAAFTCTWLSQDCVLTVCIAERPPFGVLETLASWRWRTPDSLGCMAHMLAGE